MTSPREEVKQRRVELFSSLCFRGSCLSLSCCLFFFSFSMASPFLVLLFLPGHLLLLLRLHLLMLLLAAAIVIFVLPGQLLLFFLLEKKCISYRASPYHPSSSHSYNYCSSFSSSGLMTILLIRRMFLTIVVASQIPILLLSIMRILVV